MYKKINNIYTQKIVDRLSIASKPLIYQLPLLTGYDQLPRRY